MSRIRTVKPELFRHELLFEAEIDSKLPLRLAFIALFTVCDREGRFKWRPRVLKLDCMPYDEIDFSRVLNALNTRGFIQKYTVNGEVYGCISSFKRHQVINNRESDSELPEPDDLNLNDVTNPGSEPSSDDDNNEKPRVNHASTTPHNPAQEEGKGREEEGKGKGKGTRVKREKTPLNENFSISDQVREWFSKKRYSESIELHFESFKNKCLAKGYQYSDWDAAFRNAISDDWARLRTNQNKSELHLSKADEINARNKAVLDEWLAEQGGSYAR